jgi:pyridoxal phosphate enzyme (YggS family)
VNNNSFAAISGNIDLVKTRIAAAAKRSDRCEKDVTLVCVTKTRCIEEISNVIEAGLFQLGENRVQEFVEKYDKIQHIADSMIKKPNIMWNLIGHLQRNKVKYIAGKVALIHSVDSIRLAEEIDARYKAINEKACVLIQLNPAGEVQKSGITSEDCGALVSEIDARLPNVRVCGLMAVVPVADDPEDVRGYFREAKSTFDALAEKRGGKETGFEHLSMGMTHDYEIAIEEGATIVRVGTAIFGPRGQ